MVAEARLILSLPVALERMTRTEGDCWTVTGGGQTEHPRLVPSPKPTSYKRISYGIWIGEERPRKMGLQTKFSLIIARIV